MRPCRRIERIEAANGCREGAQSATGQTRSSRHSIIGWASAVRAQTQPVLLTPDEHDVSACAAARRGSLSPCSCAEPRNPVPTKRRRRSQALLHCTSAAPDTAPPRHPTARVTLEAEDWNIFKSIVLGFQGSTSTPPEVVAFAPWQLPRFRFWFDSMPRALTFMLRTAKPKLPTECCSCSGKELCLGSKMRMIPPSARQQSRLDLPRLDSRRNQTTSGAQQLICPGLHA